jgi:hypothetical protein
MGAIARDEIKGYAFEGGMYCLECVDSEQAAGALSTDILTKEDAE